MQPPIEDANSEVMHAINLIAKDQSGVCWWCGSVADSREHKYKRSDLRRLSSGSSLAWGGDDVETRDIRSLRKSKEVLFSQTLCKRCNDTRSQPFDRAYQKYSDYVSSNLSRLWWAQGIKFHEIYGDDWEVEIVNLARYFAKHFGCLIAELGFPPPDTLRYFLNGAEDCPDVSLCLVKEESLWFGYRLFRRVGDKEGGLWISPGWASTDRKKLTGYSVRTAISYVGVQFEWHDGWGVQDSFFKHPHPILNKRKASREIRIKFAKYELQHLLRRNKVDG